MLLFKKPQMPVILIVNKSGEITETRMKSDEVSEIYKKIGYKTAEELGNPAATWTSGMDSIRIYGKTKGRAGQENKYDFPPPIDNTLFFGNVCIVCVHTEKEESKLMDLKTQQWDKIYERLFGGFEDLVDENGNSVSEEESEDDSEDADLPLTKDGYHKDGFVVDDDDSGEDDYDPEEDEKPKKKVRVRKMNVISLKKSVKEDDSAGEDSNVRRSKKEKVVKEPKKKTSKTEPKSETQTEPKVKKERKKRAGKVLSSLESAVLEDDGNEENDVMGQSLETSAELVEEEYD